MPASTANCATNAVTPAAAQNTTNITALGRRILGRINSAKESPLRVRSPRSGVAVAFRPGTPRSVSSRLNARAAAVSTTPTANSIRYPKCSTTLNPISGPIALGTTWARLKYPSPVCKCPGGIRSAANVDVDVVWIPLPMPCNNRRQNNISKVRNTFSSEKSISRIAKPIINSARRPYVSNNTPVGKRNISAEIPRTPTIAPDTAVEPPREATYSGSVPICVVIAVDASVVITITRMKSLLQMRCSPISCPLPVHDTTVVRRPCCASSSAIFPDAVCATDRIANSPAPSPLLHHLPIPRTTADNASAAGRISSQTNTGSLRSFTVWSARGDIAKLLRNSRVRSSLGWSKISCGEPLSTTTPPDMNTT